MNVSTKVENGTLFIALEGRLDTVTSQELANSLPNEKRRNLDLDLDFAKLQYVSSAGLRLLVLFKKEAQATNNKMVIRNINEVVKEIFSVTGFDKIFKINQFFMKKKVRFGLLWKIVLLTGLLTVLTVSTSLTVSLLVSHQNTLNTYKKSCEDVTDNIESAFYDEQDKSAATDVLNILISTYSTVRDRYDSLSEEELAQYSQDMAIALFDPKPGTIGTDYSKLVRKNYYTQSIFRMQTICSNSSVPYSSVMIYDSEKDCLIHLASSVITLQDNLELIGHVDAKPEAWESEFFKAASKDFQYESIIIDEVIMSYNLANIQHDNTNYKCFVTGQYSLKDVNDAFTQQLVTELLISFASATFLVIIYAILTKLFLIRNVHRLTKSTGKFVNMMKNDEPLEVIDVDVHSNDEIKDLSDEFTLMQDQIITYVSNIKEAKHKEEAFNAEVNIASKIQLESLPAPTYFDRNLELRAFIKPARGVGGDFYDYFYVDNDHLAVVIADVSGKGIPASLFMMRSKEAIRNVSMNEKDLAKVFNKVNNNLCLNNIEGFFVTAFLGVLDLKTYEFKFVSAGHERPFIKRDNKCERLNVESNFVLGLEEDFLYQEQSIQLKEGDSIILYTDGLNEAINKDKEEFGYDRIAASLSKEEEFKEKIPTLIKDLAEFEGSEEQFDDITILSFKLQKDVTFYYYLNPTYNDIDDLTDKVNAYLDNLDIKTLSKIGVVIDEVMNNIISYGKTKTNKTLNVSIEKLSDGARLIFIDNSHPFNPLLKEMRTIQENMEDGIVGGLGISIVKSISNDAEYCYANNKNILIIKFIDGE